MFDEAFGLVDSAEKLPSSRDLAERLSDMEELLGKSSHRLLVLVGPRSFVA